MEQKLTYPKDYHQFKKDILAKYTIESVNDIARNKLISYKLKSFETTEGIFSHYLRVRNNNWVNDFTTQYPTILKEIVINEIAPFFSIYSPSYNSLDSEGQITFESQRNTDILILFEALCSTWEINIEDYEKVILPALRNPNNISSGFVGGFRTS